MKAEYLNLLGHEIFVRYRISGSGNTPIFFIHGIGESGRCFFDAFGLPKKYDVIVPDLLGFGKSEKVKKNPDYSFSSQMKILREIIIRFDLTDIVLVGHSYGGILGALFSRDDNQGRIKKFVNVEGGIARDTLIESINAVSVLAEYKHDMRKFGGWLQKGGFKKKLLEDYERPSTIKYFDSVIECAPQAFAQTAVEICGRFESEDGEGNNEVSVAYKELEIPKVFCVGTRSVMASASRFLIRNNLGYKEFNVASHWIMLDKREEFYSFLDGFVTE
jgi:pimeloyl-ACP methyl ester carboxylesterase